MLDFTLSKFTLMYYGTCEQVPCAANAQCTTALGGCQQKPCSLGLPGLAEQSALEFKLANFHVAAQQLQRTRLELIDAVSFIKASTGSLDWR